MAELFTFGDSLTTHKAESVHLFGLMNSETRVWGFGFFWGLGFRGLGFLVV